MGVGMLSRPCRDEEMTGKQKESVSCCVYSIGKKGQLFQITIQCYLALIVKNTTEMRNELSLFDIGYRVRV
jgi:hypothetical protein